MGIAAFIFLVIFLGVFIFSISLKKLIGEEPYKWVLIGSGVAFAVFGVLYAVGALFAYYQSNYFWMILALALTAVLALFLLTVYNQTKALSPQKIGWTKLDLCGQLMYGGSGVIALYFVYYLLRNLFRGFSLFSGHNISLLFMVIGALAFFLVATYGLQSKSKLVFNQMRIAAIALAALAVIPIFWGSFSLLRAVLLLGVAAVVAGVFMSKKDGADASIETGAV